MSVSVSHLKLRSARAYPRRPALARGEKVIADYATFATRVAATSIAVIGSAAQLRVRSPNKFYLPTAIGLEAVAEFVMSDMRCKAAAPGMPHDGLLTTIRRSITECRNARADKSGRLLTEEQYLVIVRFPPR